MFYADASSESSSDGILVSAASGSRYSSADELQDSEITHFELYRRGSRFSYPSVRRLRFSFPRDESQLRHLDSHGGVIDKELSEPRPSA
jgi:hypothetical protein